MTTLLTRPLPPIVDDISRRGLLTGLGAAGLLTACATPTEVAPPQQTVPYVGPFGPVDLPRDPQRVVTMIAADTDYALVLGLPVIGASTGQRPAGTFPAYHADRLAGATPVATNPEVNFEAVAALRPDLLFHGAGSFHPEDDGPLSAIAPVYSFPEAIVLEDRWRPPLTDAAAMFGRGDAAAAFVAAYDERAAALRERIQARWGGATIAYVAPIEPGTFYIAQQNMQTNLTLHEDLGMPLGCPVVLGPRSNRI